MSVADQVPAVDVLQEPLVTDKGPDADVLQEPWESIVLSQETLDSIRRNSEAAAQCSAGNGNHPRCKRCKYCRGCLKEHAPRRQGFKRRDTKYCSGKCRTAACRKRKNPVLSNEEIK